MAACYTVTVTIYSLTGGSSTVTFNCSGTSSPEQFTEAVAVIVSYSLTRLQTFLINPICIPVWHFVTLLKVFLVVSLVVTM